MKVQITAKFFLDNGEFKRIVWMEVDPKLKGKVQDGDNVKEVTVTLESAKEVQQEYGKLFRKYHKDGEVFVVETITGETSGIPFSKVTYWIVKAEEVKEGKDD